MKEVLEVRSGCTCELCTSTENLEVFELDESKKDAEHAVLVCGTCKSLLSEDVTSNVNHWRVLNDTMWSEVSAVKVLIWKVLHDIKADGWSQGLIDMMYLTDDEQKWANSYLAASDSVVVHIDSNGSVLKAGDNVVLIKDLDVKGSSIIAKRGAAVRNISLDPENETYIEGKVDGQKIVILTQYVKKS